MKVLCILNAYGVYYLLENYSLRAILKAVFGVGICVISLLAMSQLIHKTLNESVNFSIEIKYEGDDLSFEVGNRTVNTDRLASIDVHKDEFKSPYTDPTGVFIQREILNNSTPLEAFESSRDELFERMIYDFAQGIKESSDQRTHWIQGLHQYLKYLCLLPLLFIGIPIVIFRKTHDVANRVKLSVGVIPFSCGAAAALSWLCAWILEHLFSIQVLQVIMGVLCVPLNAMQLDSILAIKYAPVEPVITALQTFFLAGTEWESSAGFLNPLGTTMAVHAQLSESSIIQICKYLVSFSADITLLYGPCVALLSLAFLYVIFSSLLRELLAHPLSLLDGQASSLTTESGYVKLVFKVAWVEFKAVVTTFLIALAIFGIFFILLLLTSVSGCISLVSISIWLGELVSMQTAVPEYGVAFATCSVFLALSLFSTALLLVLGVGVRTVYLISRDKFSRSVPFKSYPMFSKLMGFMFKSAAPKLIAQLIALSACCTLISSLQVSPELSIWMMGGAFVIPTLILWRFLSPIRGIVDLYQYDALER